VEQAVEGEMIMLQEVEVQEDFVLVHLFQFVEQHLIQLQLEQEELVDHHLHLKLEQQDQIQYFQQLQVQVVEEVEDQEQQEQQEDQEVEQVNIHQVLFQVEQEILRQ
jgi:hypothetical protein